MTRAGEPLRSRTTSAFDAIAYLFGPADRDVDHRVVEAERWAVDPAAFAGSSVVLWGRTPYFPGRESEHAARFALRRELALGRLRVRPPDGLTTQDIHRLKPPRWQAGAARNAARNALLSGALVELASGDRRIRVIDAVAREAGALDPRTTSLRPSLEGYALARLDLPGGRRVELRVSKSNHPANPGRGFDALRLLADNDVPLVPRPVASGETGGASWTTESVLGGTRPRRLTRRLWSQVVEICTLLPSGRAVTSLEERLQMVARTFPRWRKTTEGITERFSSLLPSLPSIVQHGDLWAGNLLEESGTLSGVVDWDCFHPAGVPGADLLQLIIGERETRGKQSFADIWASRPWASDEYRSLTRAYWREMQIRPYGDVLEAVALDCWANRVTRVIARQSHLVDDSWVEGNIDCVLGPLAGGVE